MGINIIKAGSTHNTTYKRKRKIQWIILHYTAGASSKPGRALGCASNFAKSTREASADFICDDRDIVQYNTDLENRYTWAVGGKKYPKNSTTLGAKYYGIAKNNNSISIEMCSNKKSTKTLNVTDTDWYFTDETINNAVLLTRYLMAKFNIDINHVIMHHMVTGKVCPQPWCLNEAYLINWYSFLNKVQSGVAIQPAPAPVETKPQPQPKTNTTPYIVKVLVNDLNIREQATVQSAKKGQVKKNVCYTIVEQKNGFGRLKSGAGWISINPKYVKKV